MEPTFSSALQIARDCFERDSLQATVICHLATVTMVRDIYGAIKVYLEPIDDTGISEHSLRELEDCLRASLKGHFGNDVWVITGHERAMEAELVKKIKQERQPAIWDNPEQLPRWFVLERRVAKQHWMSESSVIPPWSVEEVDAGNRPAIVTFYSFKGGVGRTTALAATALTLARRGFRVGMIDLDLEAPGLASIFLKHNGDLEGAVDYLLEKPLRPDVSIQRYLQLITEEWLGDHGEVLRVLPAAAINNDYLEKLSRLDYQHSFAGDFSSIVMQMIREFDDLANLDFILLDARAGFHDLGGLAVAGASHAVVLFGTQSRQSWAGLSQVIRQLSLTSRQELPPALLVHALAPAVSDPSWEQESAAFREQAYDTFKANYFRENDQVPNSNDTEAPFVPIVIPWNELLRGDIGLQSDSRGPLAPSRTRELVELLTHQPYTGLAERICRLFGHELNDKENAHD